MFKRIFHGIKIFAVIFTVAAINSPIAHASAKVLQSGLGI